MPHSLSNAVSITAALVSLAAACSGSTTTVYSSTDAGDDASTLPDTGTSGPDASDGSTDVASGTDASQSSPCPTSIPGNGAACSPVRLECEYGDAIAINCDTVATCTMAGGWSVVTPPNCNTQPLDGGGACPSTLAAVPEGQACSTFGLTCGYPTGICYCTIDHTGAPQIWTCFPGDASCPYPRPRLGVVCTMNNQQCDYSTCGASILCTDGTWHTGNGGCHP